MRYPACRSHTGSTLVLSRSNPYEFATTSLLCAYSPVSMLARDGQHSGVVTTESVKVVPGSAICWNVFGMYSPLTMLRG